MDIKAWTGDRFMFMGHFKQDTVAFDTYGGGTYKLEGEHYRETIVYHQHKDWIDTKMDMTLTLKGDTRVQTFPVDENLQPDTSGYAVEKYVRLH